MLDAFLNQIQTKFGLTGDTVEVSLGDQLDW